MTEPDTPPARPASSDTSPRFQPHIKAWREKADLTQGDFAALIGISQAALSRIEAGKRGWGEDFVLAAAAALGISPQDLFRHPDVYETETKMPNSLTGDYSRVQAALRAFKQGEMVVVTDDNDRENEGDLFVAASLCTPEQMAFIVRHTSGIVCAPMTSDEATRLNLQPMVAVNDAPLSTAFTVSVDVRHGLTTGISAEERTNTVRALANNNSGSGDFVRPGHVFPLVAREGGVLMRSGHTEACVDMCRLAGLPEVGVLSELVNDNGTVKRGDEVRTFAEEHGLAMVSVSELIAYRQSRESLVNRVSVFATDTPAGHAEAITYSTPFDAAEHLALVYGDLGDGNDVLVRLHRGSILEDVFGDRSGLTLALNRIQDEGRGVVVYLRDGTAGVPNTPFQPPEEDTPTAKAREEQWREIGLGAQILKDLGVQSIRLLASKSRHYVGLSGFGIAIAETIFLDG